MKKEYSYTCINSSYRGEYTKESFAGFLNNLAFEIKNKTGIASQLACKQEKDVLLITSNNEKVKIADNGKGDFTGCSGCNVEYRYDETNKQCVRVTLVFYKGMK